MAKEKFYVTTAIDYVNAEPHIGHAYQKIVADVLARWHRLLGKDVLFVTGTDEHGLKIQRSAEAAGKKPKEFVDEVSGKFKEAWKVLNIEYDRFIRTTDEDHYAVVKEIIEKVNEKGDIYKGNYEGLYCVGCEAYYTEKDAPDFVCPIHKSPLETIKEESYFFTLSAYQDFLLDLYEKHPEFVLPDKSRNEVRNRVKGGLKDLSISRTSFDWGVPFPLDEKHVTYVWFDALLNYYTATREKGREGFWPANVHLLGVDNTWFHCVYWPAMLKAAGLPLPKTVFNHGFLTFNGQKISKSLGNAISPKTLVEKYGADTIRYFVLRQFPFASGEGGDFDESALVDRHNNELANKFGNLVSRVSALAEKYGLERTKSRLSKEDLEEIENFRKNPLEHGEVLFSREIDVDDAEIQSGKRPIARMKDSEGQEFNFVSQDVLKEVLALRKRFPKIRILVEKHFENHELDKALNEIFSFIDICNTYIQLNKPWETQNKEVLYELVNAIKDFTILLSPFIPGACEKVAKNFNFKLDIKELEKPLAVKEIKKCEILFGKI